MTTSDSNNPSVSEIWKLSKPVGRFNNWGERKWVTASEEKLAEVERELSTLKLTPRAMELYKAARLTDSGGIEFVLFSNAGLPAPLNVYDSVLEGTTQIIPCFRPLTPNNRQIEERFVAMMKRGVFVYDGWAAFDEWTIEKLEEFISLLDVLTAHFSVISNYHARWEPKYRFFAPLVPSHLFQPADLNALAHSMAITNQLPQRDREAISRSVAWISNALQNPPVPKFLLLFVSIESLANYIESEAEDNSILKRAFSGKRIPKSERKKHRDECIERVLREANSPAAGVEAAYLNCVRRSIRKMLEEHMARIFGDDIVCEIMFREKVEGKTLWSLRNDIAHGNLNMLNKEETRFIESQVRKLEEIARGYLQRIFAGLAQNNYFSPPIEPILTFSASQGVGSENSEYMGPVDMADYYLQIAALSSSFVRFSF